MSDTVTIYQCRICGKLMKRNAYQVYPGDSSCCADCNREADNEEYSPNYRLKNSSTVQHSTQKGTQVPNNTQHTMSKLEGLLELHQFIFDCWQHDINKQGFSNDYVDKILDRSGEIIMDLIDPDDEYLEDELSPIWDIIYSHKDNYKKIGEIEKIINQLETTHNE